MEIQNKLVLAAITVGAFVLMAGLVFALQVLPRQGRRYLVMAITFIAGAFFAVEFFWPLSTSADGEKVNFLTKYTTQMQNFMQIITGVALVLGIVGLFRIHGRAVVQKRANWGYSTVLILSLVIMATLSIWSKLAEKKAVASNQFVETAYTLAFQRVFISLEAVMFSLIAFYIFSAAYRAFRIRSIEASILMATAMIVMLGVIPLAGVISNAFGLPTELSEEASKKPFSMDAILYSLRGDRVSDWILKALNGPAQRAIEFGVGIGGLAMALRLWLSLERGIGVER